jgi:hypothetical protein
VGESPAADTDAVSERKREPNTTRRAPIGSVDLAAFKEDGTPYEIWPCHDCLPWHAEAVRIGDEIRIREWHAFDCPQLQELINR